jgi:hypothetical protein
VQWGPPVGLSVTSCRTAIGFLGRWCPAPFCHAYKSCRLTARLSEVDSAVELPVQVELATEPLLEKISRRESLDAKLAVYLDYLSVWPVAFLTERRSGRHRVRVLSIAALAAVPLCQVASAALRVHPCENAVPPAAVLRRRAGARCYWLPWSAGPRGHGLHAWCKRAAVSCAG